MKNKSVKLLQLFKFLFSARKEWKLPGKCEILIYDACGSEVFLPYLKSYSVTIFCARGERINVPSLLISVLYSNFWKGNLYQAYLEAFVSIAAPVIAITFIDNDIRFYELSNNIKRVNTVIVQNGYRGFSGDLFDGLKRSSSYKVDFMLVYGQAVKNQYLKYINGMAIVVGSFKNNMVHAFDGNVKDSILFISQWRPNVAKDGLFYTESDGTPIYWNEFYKAELAVLKFLDKWCLVHGKTLQICGFAHNSDFVQESKFYSENLTSCDWFYHRRESMLGAYKLVDSFEIVVTIDSSLGYESLARGKKTAFFCCRQRMNFKQISLFGWPAAVQSDGPFWTNELDVLRFDQIMNYLSTVNNEDWEEVRRKHASQIIDYDASNSIFASLLEKLLLEHKTKNPVMAPMFGDNRKLSRERLSR
jgi:surface carbohydrate biosynthesis protein